MKLFTRAMQSLIGVCFSVSLAFAGPERADGAVKLEINLHGSLQNPVFSPDGSQVLFTRFRDGYNRGISDLYLFSLADGALRVLVSDGSSNVNLPGASWNATTNQIVFSSERGAHDEIYSIAANGQPGDEQRLTNRLTLQAYEPSFSPDGKWVVFESHLVDDEAGTITKVRVGSHEYVDLTLRSEIIKQPNWSPMGGRILYQAISNGEWAIYELGDNGGPSRRITPIGISATDASYGPDGRLIYFSGETDGVHLANIFAILPDAGTLRQITQWNGYDGAVSVSPNGRYIVFEGSKADPDTGRGTVLWLLDLR